LWSPAMAMPSRTRRTSAARDPIPSPKLPTSLATSARFLLTACAAPPFGIRNPRIRLRVVRWAIARPLASPARPAPAASAGVFAFFATSVRLLPLAVLLLLLEGFELPELGRLELRLRDAAEPREEPALDDDLRRALPLGPFVLPAPGREPVPAVDGREFLFVC
jgi:hypothetical protein